MSDQKSWLERLKNESWEAELLVSAVAIFGIFQCFDLVDYFINFLIKKLEPPQYMVGYFIAFMGLLAISILAAMFIIHFILRSYWIGLVGLNSVFPDYSLKDSAYSEIYTKKMMEFLPKLSKTIDGTDDLCSVIFSAAFTILGIYTYIATLSSLYLFIFNLLKDYVPKYILLIPVGVLVFILVFQSLMNIFANLKQFKSNERLQNLFFYVAKISSLISFGPLAKNFLQVSMIFGSNFKKKKGLVYLVLLFFGVGAILSTFHADRTNLFYLINSVISDDESMNHPFFYSTNNTNKSFLLHPEIETDVIEKKTTKLFIPIFDNEVSYFKKLCNLEKPGNIFNSDKETIQKVRTAYLDCYEKNHNVLIDGKEVDLDFLKYDHEVTGQFGIQGFIDCSTLSNGPHRITVVKNGRDDIQKNWTIPFYYVADQ